MSGRITLDEFKKAAADRGLSHGDVIEIIRDETGVPVRVSTVTRYAKENGTLSAFMSASIQLFFNQWDARHG